MSSEQTHPNRGSQSKPLQEEAAAELRQSIRESGRRKGGVMGAAIAGAMIAVQEIYEGRLFEEIAIVAEADGEPHDLDTDGVRLSIEHNHISAPPIERDPPEE